MSQPTLYVFSNEAIRELDREAIESYGIPGVVLMENAARAVAEQSETLLDDDLAGRSVVICCGPGNNGGDGLGAARHLHNSGADVLILACFDPDKAKLSEEAAINLKIVQAMGITIMTVNEKNVKALLRTVGQVDLAIDALLGTGSSRRAGVPRAPMDALIAWMNESAPLVLSVDIPTGLPAELDGNEAVAVRADQTITFVGLKEDFLREGAEELYGEIVIADIGSPRELSAKLGEPVEM